MYGIDVFNIYLYTTQSLSVRVLDGFKKLFDEQTNKETLS